jgi:hypothetical protein
MFFKGSRYEKVAEAEWTDASRRSVRHKKIRYIQDTSANFSYRVAQSDRLDLLAERFYRDPERFWRICDCNVALWPEELLEQPGRELLIPTSEG